MQQTVKTYPSEGQRVLRKRLAKRGKAAELARKIGVDPGVVSHWKAATRKPSSSYRDVLQDELGINRRLWDAPPRKGAA